MENTARNKRIVFEYTTGHLTGLRQIVGTTEELPALPPLVSDVVFREHKTLMSLVAVKRTYILYREPIVPPSGRFNEFHPHQI
jgi:hypothetical protein